MKVMTRATRWASLSTVVTALVATMAFTPVSLAQPAPDEPPQQASREAFLRAKLAHMTLEEKVGQLFFTFVKGQRADDSSGAADNQANYGVDTPGEVVQKYHLGGVTY